MAFLYGASWRPGVVAPLMKNVVAKSDGEPS